MKKKKIDEEVCTYTHTVLSCGVYETQNDHTRSCEKGLQTTESRGLSFSNEIGLQTSLLVVFLLT